MPDYAEMYKKLFRSQTKAIQILQQAQQETEELYISDEGPDLIVLQPQESEDNSNEEDGDRS
jgi:hypothetical protein